MTTLSQIAEVQSIVREATGYEATVAGGAVRDLRLGRPVKDIDVFVVRSREEDMYDAHPQRVPAKKAAKALGGTAFRSSSESEYPDGEQVYSTYEVDTRYGMVNLIFVEDLSAALNEFPDELAQAQLLDDGTPYYSEAFEKHARNIERGLITGVLTNMLAGNKRIERLSKKYPEVRWLVRDESMAYFQLEEWA